MILLFAIGLVLLRVLYSLAEIYFERDWPRTTWRGLAISLGLLLMCCSAFGQVAARVDIPLLTSGPNVPASGNPLPQALWVSNSSAYLCVHPSSTLSYCQAHPITTYTDSTEGSTCPSATPLVQLPGSTCTAFTGTQSNLGFWYAGGAIDYYIASSYGTFGPFSYNPPANAVAGNYVNTTQTAPQTIVSTLTGPGFIAGGIPVYDVRAFASLQAAATAASVTGGVIYLPTGYTTTLSTGIALTANVKILCDSGATVTDAISTSNGATFSFSNGTGQGIEGCTIIGNNSTLQAELILTSGTTNAEILNNTITNAGHYKFNNSTNPSGLAAFQSVNDTNLTIADNDCPTCFMQMWGGTSLGLSLRDNILGGFFIQPIDETKPGPVTFSAVHNTLTPLPALWANATCGGGGDFTIGSVSPIINWDISHNKCTITGSSSGAHAFGGWSIVKENTSNGTFSDNQTIAISQYLDLGGLEFGGTSSSIVNNEFILTDTNGQGYDGIESYANGNTINDNTIQDWGQHGSGIRVFPLSGAGSGNHNTIVGNNLSLSNSASSSASGIAVVCNYNGNSATDNTVKANNISIAGSGTSTIGIDLQDSSAGTLCPYSASVDGNHITGGTYGIRPNNGTVWLGMNSFDGTGTILQTAGSPTINPQYLYSVSIANSLKLANGTAMTGNQGNGVLLQHSTGTLINGNIAASDSNHNVVDGGVAASAVVTAGSPTVGQATCVKTLGPPIVFGYCSTVVGAGGACTCN